MKWNVGTKMSLGFGLVLLVSILVAVASSQSTNRLIRVSDERKHRFEALLQLDQLQMLLSTMQSSQRGYVLSGEDRFLLPNQDALAKLPDALRELRAKTANEPRQQRLVETLEPLIKARVALNQQRIDTRRASGIEATVQLIKEGEGETNMEEIRKVVSEIRAEEETALSQTVDAAEDEASNTRWTIALGSIAAILVAAIAGGLITRNIASPLVAMNRVAERMATGDLTVSLAGEARTDEIGMLRSTFVRMSENLRQQISGLSEAANVLGSSANEIVASASQLATGATETATAVNETTTTVEEVRQTSQVTSQKAKLVSDNAQKAAQTYQGGRKSTEDVATGMNRIREQMGMIAESMIALSEQNRAIGQIIAAVEDLSAQSNLLAVNAAIEAAKAGEHGKGFSVVAQEVKSLAEQSRQATTQVRSILGEIQKATTAAVMVTEQGSKAVEAGEKHTGVAGESMNLLAGTVTDAAQAATQIAASSQQQLIGMDQVAVAMENIKQTSCQNVASARQLENAARNLHELGQKMKQMVEKYKV